MGIFSRLFKIGEAKTNKMIDALEKPDEMLDQAIRDQDKHIRETKESVRSVIATERETKALLDEEKENKVLWEQKAEAALRAGKEDLATKALTRSEEHESKILDLEPQWKNQREEVEKLKLSIKKMEEELAELRRNKEIIVAQHKAAQVKKKIYDAKAKIGKNKTADLIERMKAKAKRVSYEAQASEEMANDKNSTTLEDEFKDLDNASSSKSVQDKLSALKEKIKK